jgi:hypothetical protein
MPRGPAPQWRARKEPVADDYLMASVNQAGGQGSHHPETGFYAELILRGLADRAEAEEWRRALHRAARYLDKWGICPIGVTAKIERAGGGYLVRFKAVDKKIAQGYVVRVYGPDPSAWPYHARRRGAS